MLGFVHGLIDRAKSWPTWRVFRHRDFRLIWIGALISFTGGQIQMVAQGAYVYELTGRKTALGLVAFFSMIPVTLLGPLAAVLVDVWDRKKILVATTVIMFLATIWNAISATSGVLSYAQILAVALIGGLMQTVEPTSRQTILREVVGEEDLAQAVPLQAMTFNLARTIGPAIGGAVTALAGVAVCFWVNAVSFLGILGATLAIRTPVEVRSREPQPIKDLLFEGMLFTLKHPSLLVLFLMESTLSLFGVPYLFQMPAIVKDRLGLDESGLGFCYTAIGVGAMAGLLTLATISDRPVKTKIVRIAMTVFGLGLFLLSFVGHVGLAFPLLSVLGFCQIAQFNTTNTLFQLLSPPALRGRVLSMHLWAIAGIAPLGNLWMGVFGDRLGLGAALGFGGCCVFLGACWAWIVRDRLVEPQLSTD
jgi:MFS family permease